MEWKNWPYWLKGGIILLIIHSILTLIGFLFLYDSTDPNGDVALIILPNIIIPLIALNWMHLPLIFGKWSSIFYFSIFWFIIGTLIGWIYGKIKSKKRGRK